MSFKSWSSKQTALRDAKTAPVAEPVPQPVVGPPAPDAAAAGQPAKKQ